MSDGSPELDADAAKLAAMGADPGPELNDFGDWIECWDCGGEGFNEDECTCGDDTCCCLEPDGPLCGTCCSEGGWKRELSCDDG